MATERRIANALSLNRSRGQRPVYQDDFRFAALAGDDARASGWLALAEGNLQKLQMTMGKIPDGVDPLPSGCSQGGVPAGWLALLGALALGYRRRR